MYPQISPVLLETLRLSIIQINASVNILDIHAKVGVLYKNMQVSCNIEKSKNPYIMNTDRVNNSAPLPEKLHLTCLNVSHGIHKLIKLLAKTRGWVKEVFRELLSSSRSQIKFY